MSAELFRRGGLQSATTSHTLDPAFAARPRLIRLRDELARAAKQLRTPRWNEPAVFFFDRKRQTELEAARPAPTNRFAALADFIAAEMPTLLAHVEIRRVARALDGLKDAALALATHCRAANDLADLLAVPDDEVFLVLSPANRTGIRLHVRGAANVAQFHQLLSEPTPPAPLPEGKGEPDREPDSLPLPFRKGGRGGRSSSSFQLFTPRALLPNGALPTGFGACEHWLWPTQPLAVVPRVYGERVVLVGPAVVRASLDVEPRFPEMTVESEVLQTLNPFQVIEALSRLTGQPVPVAVPTDAPPVARAA